MAAAFRLLAACVTSFVITATATLPTVGINATCDASIISSASLTPAVPLGSTNPVLYVNGQPVGGPAGTTNLFCCPPGSSVTSFGLAPTASIVSTTQSSGGYGSPPGGYGSSSGGYGSPSTNNAYLGYISATCNDPASTVLGPVAIDQVGNEPCPAAPDMLGGFEVIRSIGPNTTFSYRANQLVNQFLGVGGTGGFPGGGKVGSDVLGFQAAFTCYGITALQLVAA